MADMFDDPFIDSDEEFLRSWRDHPARWDGPPRYTARCPGCNRGLYTLTVLEPVPGSTIPVCRSCRFWHRRLQHTEELRRSAK
jgi:hypothetical protein